MRNYDRGQHRKHNPRDNTFERNANQSHMQRYDWYGGRPYLAHVPYILPKDKPEIERLDFQHSLLKDLIDNNLYVSPVREPEEVLDIGCGTGIWGHEVACNLPEATVINIDVIPPPVERLSEIERRPDNFIFAQLNILQGLPFSPNAFDFVHQRFVSWGIPSKYWTQHLQEIKKVTASGAWVEFMEPGLIQGGGSALETLQEWILKIAQRREVDLLIPLHLDRMMINQGFEEVTMSPMVIPLGREGGRLGILMESNLMGVFRALKGLANAYNIATETEYDHLLMRVQGEIRHYECSWMIYTVFGQRR
jgi:SAM-dependent methyltransferase